MVGARLPKPDGLGVSTSSVATKWHDMAWQRWRSTASIYQL